MSLGTQRMSLCKQRMFLHLCKMSDHVSTCTVSMITNRTFIFYFLIGATIRTLDHVYKQQTQTQTWTIQCANKLPANMWGPGGRPLRNCRCRHGISQPVVSLGIMFPPLAKIENGTSWEPNVGDHKGPLGNPTSVTIRQHLHNKMVPTKQWTCLCQKESSYGSAQCH